MGIFTKDRYGFMREPTRDGRLFIWEVPDICSYCDCVLDSPCSTTFQGVEFHFHMTINAKRDIGFYIHHKGVPIPKYSYYFTTYKSNTVLDEVQRGDDTNSFTDGSSSVKGFNKRGVTPSGVEKIIFSSAAASSSYAWIPPLSRISPRCCSRQFTAHTIPKEITRCGHWSVLNSDQVKCLLDNANARNGANGAQGGIGADGANSGNNNPGEKAKDSGISCINTSNSSGSNSSGSSSSSSSAGKGPPLLIVFTFDDDQIFVEGVAETTATWVIPNFRYRRCSPFTSSGFGVNGALYAMRVDQKENNDYVVFIYNRTSVFPPHVLSLHKETGEEILRTVPKPEGDTSSQVLIIPEKVMISACNSFNSKIIIKMTMKRNINPLDLLTNGVTGDRLECAMSGQPKTTKVGKSSYLIVQQDDL